MAVVAVWTSIIGFSPLFERWADWRFPEPEILLWPLANSSRVSTREVDVTEENGLCRGIGQIA